MVKKANNASRAGQTIEALVTPDLKRDFAYYCHANEVPMNELAGEAIQLLLDMKKADFSKLEKDMDSPLIVAVNNMMEQLQLVTKLLMQINRQNAAIAKAISYGGQLPQSGLNDDEN